MTDTTRQKIADLRAQGLFQGWSDERIAREMFPRELVEAAREASYECAYCNNGELAPEWRGYR